MSDITRTFVVDLRIGANEFSRLYSGVANAVVARARGGLTVRFPAGSLRPFVTHDGVHGAFALVIDSHNKLVSIDRVTSNGPRK